MKNVICLAAVVYVMAVGSIALAYTNMSSSISGDRATITVSYWSSSLPAVGELMLGLTGPVTFDFGSIAGIYSPSEAWGLGEGPMVDDGGYGPKWLRWRHNWNGAFACATDEGDLFTIDLIGASPSWVWVNERPEIFYAKVDHYNTQNVLTQSIYAVPEPITAGLLSMGALFLRRRR